MTAKATMINSSIEQLRKIANELEASSETALSSIRKLHEAANKLVALANSLTRCERVGFADVWPKKLCKKDAEHYRLPLYLGVTPEGEKHIVDLARMPHLLVGGNDARGKSNLIHSIVCGLTQLLSPEQIRFVVLDSSCADFASYMKLPHLAHPIITEDEEHIPMLDSLINEMESRLKLFARARCRNIDDFNRRKENSDDESIDNLFGIDIDTDKELPDSVPYIVVVLNEITRLPIVVHSLISRLTARGRSAGIHLILSMQFVNTLTLPASLRECFRSRIAFKTSDGGESKLLINSPQAEMLSGAGIMLVWQQDNMFPVRTQSTDISPTEEMSIIEEAQKKYASIKPLIETNTDPFAHISNAPQIDYEELYKMALEIIRTTKRASIPHFQIQMGIGYNRASRLMDLLEERGVVGERKDGLQREINIDLENGDEMKSNGG